MVFSSSATTSAHKHQGCCRYASHLQQVEAHPTLDSISRLFPELHLRRDIRTSRTSAMVGFCHSNSLQMFQERQKRYYYSYSRYSSFEGAIAGKTV